jgi:FKBP-type peptidyl-prolyl cis-trans isomerase
MKKLLIVAIVGVLVILIFMLSRDKSLAPTSQQQPVLQQSQPAQTKSQPVATEQPTAQQAQPAPEPVAKQSNDKKTMELEIKTTQEGSGAAVKAGDTVGVLYTGKLQDGTVFDASVKHGNQPFEFTVGAGMVIKGWDQGLLGAKVGEKRTLTIPGDLAYGPNGIPGTIPPNATLIFDIEVLSIK